MIENKALDRKLLTLSDEEKKSLLKNTTFEDDKARIIASLDSEEDRKEFLKNIKDEECRAHIIATLSSDADKKEYLKDIKDLFARSIIIASFSKDEEKLLYALELTTEKVIANYDSADFNQAMAQIGESFEQDSNKIAILPFISNIFLAARVGASIKDNEMKKKLLLEHREYFELSEERGGTSCVDIVISSFDNRKDKKLFVDSVKSEADRAEIIASYDDDEDKELALTHIKDQKNRETIILSFKDQKRARELLKDTLEELDSSITSVQNEIDELEHENLALLVESKRKRLESGKELVEKLREQNRELSQEGKQF